MRYINYKNHVIPYKVIRKPIKNMYLRIKKEYIQISVPYFCKEELIKDFLLKHIDKFLKKLNSKYYLLGEEIGKKLDDNIYKYETISIVNSFLEIYTKKMNLYPTKVSFRFKKTSWGSCSSKNSIIFNSYLSIFSPEIIEYIVVHELAHIKYKNHSKYFWREVEKYIPDYKERIKKLRKIEKEINV